MPATVNVAILDDYQGVALSLADWSAVQSRAKVTAFHDHLADEDAVAERLAPFDVICVMRERTPMTAALLARLPRLKFIVSTGPRNASIDVAAGEKHGIAIAHTGHFPAPAMELTRGQIQRFYQDAAAHIANYIGVSRHTCRSASADRRAAPSPARE
ncbi:hypothetical protein LJR289_001109 [Pseudoduganella sp. LjRoot289]|uniref:hypothetical protein n=1 Tax=Pseudoduganella sp. LjRoot289 TaxID=3342314 RepID=UPI003ECD6805